MPRIKEPQRWLLWRLEIGRARREKLGKYSPAVGARFNPSDIVGVSALDKQVMVRFANGEVITQSIADFNQRELAYLISWLKKGAPKKRKTRKDKGKTKGPKKLVPPVAKPQPEEPGLYMQMDFWRTAAWLMYEELRRARGGV